MVTLGVHRLEKTFVPEGAQLIVAGQPLQGSLLPYRIVAFEILADLGRQDEKAAVHEASFAFRLLAKADDAVAHDVERTEAPGRVDGRDRRQLAVGAVKRDRLADVHVRDA